MTTQVDRVEAQEIADMLGIVVSAIPEDHEALTSQLWEMVGLGPPMPEAIETRWELITAAVIGRPAAGQDAVSGID